MSDTRIDLPVHDLRHADVSSGAAPAQPGAREIVLTGDRPTGPLHLGHYAGSLKSRLELQDRYQQTILVADLQALTDNAGRPSKVADHVVDVVLDYLAVGIDPQKTTIAVQSQLPALAELTVLYLNLVTVSRLERNPTVRSEIEMRKFARDIPAGFLCYPVSQAADITGFRGTVIPVGEDQVPMIEQTNEIVRRVNRIAGTDVLPECSALLSATPRLPGTDGRKASKSLGNAISLSATPDEIKLAVRSMFTDPSHLRANDPGQIEGNVVFAYLDAFDADQRAVADLKVRYTRGGLGDATIKQRLVEVLDSVLTPIRERRSALAEDLGYVRTVLNEGTARARAITDSVSTDVRRVLSLGACGLPNIAN
jgi:tryptophanyl-tRNA synthetase